MIKALAFLFGLFFGSFANVVIHRIPRDLSIVQPGSACPNCHKPIAWYDNIPLASWIALGRKCRYCRNPISIRYPLVELATALAWVAVAARFGPTPQLPAFLVFSFVLVVLGAIDLEHRRIPNKILAPASAIGLILFSVAAVWQGDGRDLGEAVIGAFAYGLPMLAIALIVPHGMGGGDIKLAGYIGLHLGWVGLDQVAVGALLGFGIGGVAGLGLMAAGRKGRKDPIPFGPSMAAGAFLAMLAGRHLSAFWLG